MSGGTDSSVAAMLLQDAGYEVTGITFRFYEPNNQTQYLNDAASLASQLKIKHIVFDARPLFQEKVVQYFINEYMEGRTPVPCVICNNQLKWKLLRQVADELQINYISCGHYAQIISLNRNYYVADGVDPEKNQSFFLWGLSQDILKRTIFPLGEFNKGTVRKIAAERGFSAIAAKKDSIGVCFCPSDYRSFLRNHLPNGQLITSGFFEDESGKIIGKHQGYPFYTVGQRRGLGINFQKPTFVKAIIPETNRVVLSELNGLERTTMQVEDYKIVDEADFNEPVICKIRYRKQATWAKVSDFGGDYLTVDFLEPVTAVASGQSAVFYKGNQVLGGGIIR